MTTALKQQEATAMGSISANTLGGINQLEKSDIKTILDLAQDYADQLDSKQPVEKVLDGKTILSLFFEDSTRTRASFEMAAVKLGADWLNIDLARSSLSKGETFLDTLLTVANIARPDAIVIRHSEYGTPDFVKKYVDCPVINAGDSYREHPTQALLDALTIRQHKGAIEGLNVAICGDIAHSRVANSNMILLTKMGANVRVVAPEMLLPKKYPADGIDVYANMDEGLADCDIVMMLRIQKERMEDSMIESDAAYFNKFGLTQERLANAKPDALVMHPGPMNRGIEIADDVADDPHRSLILKQVANGVPTRMAVMDLLIKR